MKLVFNNLYFIYLFIINISIDGNRIYDINVNNLINEITLIPKTFDLYIFAQSWQPAFCHNKEESFPGCTLPHIFWRKNLTIHGLWPNNKDGTHPDFCYKIPFNISIMYDIGYNVFLKYWPNVKMNENNTNIDKYISFWKHEWERHGTCSGLNQKTYFEQALFIEKFKIKTPILIQEHIGKSTIININDLYNAYGGKEYVVLICLNDKYLSQVYTCWNKDNKNQPDKNIPCPKHVLIEDTCKHLNKVEILDFK